MTTEFIKTTNTAEKLRLIKAAATLSEHLVEFNGKLQDQKYLTELDEALIQICGVNSWEEILDFTAKHS